MLNSPRLLLALGIVGLPGGSISTSRLCCSLSRDSELMQGLHLIALLSAGLLRLHRLWEPVWPMRDS